MVSIHTNLILFHGLRSCIEHTLAAAELRGHAAVFVGKFNFDIFDPDEIAIAN